jgi:hypothetical protein
MPKQRDGEKGHDQQRKNYKKHYLASDKFMMDDKLVFSDNTPAWINHKAVDHARSETIKRKSKEERRNPATMSGCVVFH